MMSYIQGHPYASSFGYSWILEMEMILISRRHKYCLLGRLSHEVGWNYYDTIKWTFHPFIFQSKKIYTVLLWRRVLAFLCISASITFL